MSAGRVVAIGIRTPSGLDARQALLTLRAQRWPSRRLELPVGPDDAVGPSVCGTVRCAYLPDDLWGADRLVPLAAPALDECVRSSPEAVPAPVAVVLAGPERRGGEVLPAARALLASLGEAARVDLDLDRSEVVIGGHAGFAIALERGLALSRTSGTKVLVGAVDTYHDPAALRWLDAERRLHGPSTHDGLIPSEGAAFLLVDASVPAGAPRLATIAAVATGADEPSEDDPRVAVAFTEVVRRATSGYGSERVPWIVSDQNGERDRAKEWTIASIRLSELLDGERTRLETPAHHCGDLGAASGAVFAAVVCSAWELGVGHGPSALVTLASDGPPRGALVLEAPR